MNSSDYAIIVGLQVYPGLDDAKNGHRSLCGPENDARAFMEWVTAVDGGNIPRDNVEIILSSDHPQPFESVVDAKPVAADVQKAFHRLRNISEYNIGAGKGPMIGRRLYIFMAGHGVSPATFGDKFGMESALLMADVDRRNGGAAYHIPGAYVATWFWRNDCFDEIFLFMDCCREIMLVPGINMFLPVGGNSYRAKWCHAFATKWSRLSRERELIDDDGIQRTHGVFTKTLLLGLSGAAAQIDPHNPHQGQITVASLKSYLYQNTKKLLEPDQIDTIDIQEPDIDFWPKREDGKDILIKTVPLQKFPVVRACRHSVV